MLLTSPEQHAYREENRTGDGQRDQRLLANELRSLIHSVAAPCPDINSRTVPTKLRTEAFTRSTQSSERCAASCRQ